MRPKTKIIRPITVTKRKREIAKREVLPKLEARSLRKEVLRREAKVKPLRQLVS
jgi:hypothetical protein